MFSCKRCNFTTNVKCVLLNHLKRKKICNSEGLGDYSRELQIKELTERVIKESHYACENCGKQFTHQAGQSRHQKKCNSTASNSTSNIDIKNNTSPVIVGNNNTVNSNNITNNIVILNAQGKEDVQYIVNSPDFHEFMVKCMKLQDEGIVQLLTKIHFDPSHPENHNIAKTNKKDNFVQIYDGVNWNTRKTNSRTSDDILKNAENLFNTFFENIKIIENGSPQEPVILRKRFLDNFMEVIGEPLGWDLDNKAYTFEGDKDKDFNNKKREEFEELLWETFYQNTKKHFSKK